MLFVASILSFCAALATLWLKERALPPGAETVALGIAAALLTLSVALCARAYAQSRAHSAQATRLFAKSLATGFVGLGLWTLSAKLREGVLAALIGPFVMVLWPGVLLLGVVPALFEAWALSSMRLAPAQETWRVAKAGRAAHIIVLSLITFAALNHAAVTYNRKWDLSYFKISQVSPASHSLAASLNKSVSITLFFPPGNDVLEQVRAYCEELGAASPWLEVAVLDQALEPARARALKVRRNGTVAVTSGSKTELLRFELDVEESRAALRRLDGDMHRALLTVTQPPAIVYVTDGHGERSVSGRSEGDLPGLGDFKTLLENQGFVLRPLGLAEGLGHNVPDDAAVVAIMGPTRSFAPQETAALAAYLGRGGHVLACLDPDREGDDEALTTLLSVEVSRARVGNPHYQVRAEHQSSSPFNLVTVRASGHPSVHSLEAHPGRLGLIFLGAGSVTPSPKGSPGAQVTPVVHAMPDSFIDRNGNGRPDPDERPSLNIPLAAAVEWPQQGDAQARAIVIGDVDLATDGVLRNVGNSYLLSDAMGWLSQSPRLAHGVHSEEDVPLVHRKDADAVWFYGVSFGAPLLVLAVGLITHERDRKRMRRPADASPPPSAR